MKKKIFGAVVVIAIAVGAMINVNLNKTSNKGDLAIANVEALAQEASQVSYLGQWYNNNVAPWIIGAKTYKGRESYPKRIETGGTTYGSSYSYNVGAQVSNSGAGASAGYSYNSEHTNVDFTTIYCCTDSFEETSCNLPYNPLC